MRRLKLIVAYDGTQFSGWQSQPNLNGIQDHLESAFHVITGRRLRVHGAGRTDAGVHALAQCAHVDLTNERLGAGEWLAALNALLPNTIRIMRAQFVSQSFHARFSAKGKVYRYRIYTGRVLPPFERMVAWHVTAPLDVRSVEQTAALFVGTHDFGGFAAAGRKTVDTTRTIRSAHVRNATDRLTLEFDGEGFLYKMVRLLVGAVVQVGIGRSSIAEVAARIQTQTSNFKPQTAPAHALVLVRVRY